MTCFLATLLAAVAGIALFFGWWFQIEFAREMTGFGYVLACGIVLSLGVVFVVFRGLLRETESVPDARSWPLRKLVLALAAVMIVTWMTFASLDTAVKMQLDRYARGRGENPALSPARVTDGTNAAPIYLDAFELMTPETPIPSVRSKDKQSWEKYDRAAINPKDKELHDFLQGQQAALALLRKGAAQPGCWFERDYFQGWAMLLPELQQVRRGAVLLACDSLVLAAQGNSRLALQDVAAIFAIARQLDEPVLVSMLVSIAVEEIGFRAAPGCVEVVATQERGFGGDLSAPERSLSGDASEWAQYGRGRGRPDLLWLAFHGTLARLFLHD